MRNLILIPILLLSGCKGLQVTKKVVDKAYTRVARANTNVQRLADSYLPLLRASLNEKGRVLRLLEEAVNASNLLPGIKSAFIMIIKAALGLPKTVAEKAAALQVGHALARAAGKDLENALKAMKIIKDVVDRVAK